MTLSLEDQANALRRRISDLTHQLESVEGKIHRRRVRETGLVGKFARSDRCPKGIRIEDVTFKTWEPTQPQSVSGPRLTPLGTPACIHLTSPGFQIYED